MAGAKDTGAFAPTRKLHLKSSLFLVCTFAFLLSGLLVLFTPTNSLAEEAPIANEEISASEKGPTTKELLGSARPKTPSLLGQVSKGMIYCIGALLLMLGLYKQFGPTKGVKSTSINVLSQRALTSKHSLIIAEVEGQRLLIGAGGDQLSLIKELAPVAPTAEKKKEGAISVAVNNG